MTKRRYTFLLTAASTVVMVISLLGLTSCREDNELPPLYDTDGISIILKEGAPFRTKSGDGDTFRSHREVVINGENTPDIFLEVSESDIHTGTITSSEVETKATPYSTSIVGNFTIVSYLDGSTTPFFSKEYISDGTNPVPTGYYWPITTPETKIDFFGYAQSTTNGSLTDIQINPTNPSGSFKYTLDDPVTAGDDANKDATLQSDIVFAIAPDVSNTGTAIPMKFYHALSSIVFTVGNVPSQIKIESVSFKNIYRKGSCEYSLSGGDVIFTWVADGETEDYLQTFSKEIGSAAEDAAINETSQTFIMIPQQFDTETSKISIVISFDGRQYTIEKPLKTFISSWEAGKEYKFKISSPEEVNIVVDDEIDTSGEYPVKRNLTITNTGISPVYVRAAIVGNWVMPNGEIIASWHVENEVNGTGYGVFDWGQASNAVSQEPSLPDQTTTNWCKYEGYYYYLKPVPAGEMTDPPLFNTYTLTKFYPQNNAELELIIAVQALHPNDIGLWPESVLTKLNQL